MKNKIIGIFIDYYNNIITSIQYTLLEMQTNARKYGKVYIKIFNYQYLKLGFHINMLKLSMIRQILKCFGGQFGEYK